MHLLKNTFKISCWHNWGSGQKKKWVGLMKSTKTVGLSLFLCRRRYCCFNGWSVVNWLPSCVDVSENHLPVCVQVRIKQRNPIWRKNLGTNKQQKWTHFFLLEVWLAFSAKELLVSGLSVSFGFNDDANIRINRVWIEGRYNYKQTNKQETKIIKIILQQKGKRNNYNKQTKKANEL